MRCKSCGADLGDGMLPARCPECGANLRNVSDRGGAGKAAASRREVEGLTGIGRGSKRGRGGNIGRVLLAVALVGLFVGGVWYVLSHVAASGEVLPDVVGWRLERAQERLQEDGYSVTYSEQPTLTATAGTVVSQSPTAGESVPSGTRVALVIARAPVMPDIVGKTQQEAEDALKAEGIDYEIVEEAGSGDPGTVLATSLEAGRTPSATSVVRVTVAASLTVPDLVGKTELEAQNALVQAGLVGEFKNSPAASGVKAGTVLSTEPIAGASVDKGATVTVYVAGSAATTAKANAEKILAIIYDNDNPSAESIGEALRPYLSEKSGYATATADEIWTGLVKSGGKHQDVPQAIQSLPRSIVSESVTTNSDGTEAKATVTVKWVWDPMGSGYEGVVSQDTHTVTMTFDDEGKLVSFNDPQTDVPTYVVEEGSGDGA